MVMSLRRLVALMKVFVMFVVGNTMTVIMRTSRPKTVFSIVYAMIQTTHPMSR